MTGADDFRGRRPSKDGMPVEGVDFDKILALLPLKRLIFLPNKVFISSTSLKFSAIQELKLFQDKRKFFWCKLLCRCKGSFLLLILLCT